MPCCGQHRGPGGRRLLPIDGPSTISPTEQCLFCAEKHLSTAYALAMESGYETPNRQRIVGELVSAQWHLFRTDYSLAEIIRAARHAIQMREETKVEWAPMLAAVSALVETELDKEKVRT